MQGNDRIVIFTTASKGDGVRRHIEQTVDSKGQHLNLLLRQLPSLNDAIEVLDSGTGDLIAMSPWEWKSVEAPRFSLIGILPRREPTWVLVSNDNPDRLVKDPVIICDSELLRRQFLRVRNDANIRTSSEVIVETQMDERQRWLVIEDMRSRGEIDGYVVPRSLYTMLNIRSRRHTLGLQRETPKGSREHFIPPPLHGFTLLVGRSGFPAEEVSSLCDPSALLAFRIETMLHDNVSDEFKDVTGIYAEQRKLGTLMNESKRNNDGFFEKFYIDSEDKPLRSGPQIEIFIETINYDGTVAIGCYKVVELEAIHQGSINILREFETICDQLQTDFEELKRAPETMPEEYKHARKKLFEVHKKTESP
jgi:hypothetical protein